MATNIIERFMEPAALKRGKSFHKEVQSDWELTSDGDVISEHTIDLTLVHKNSRRIKKGRLDIFVSEMGDFVSVVEIKATDWDKIKPKNIQRNLASHRRQTWKYIQEYTDKIKIDVCAGVIYPHAPKGSGLKDRIEKYMGEYGLQVVWYHD